MINICHVVSDTNFGGAGRVLLHCCTYADTSKFSLTVVLPKGSALLEHLRGTPAALIEVDGLYDRSFSRADVRLLTKLFRSRDFQLIHSHGALSARIAAKRCRLPVIYTRHSVFDLPGYATRFPVRQLQGFLNNRLADGVIAVSPAAKELLVATGSDPRKIRVIFNGVPPVPPGEPVFRRRYGLKDDDFVLGIVARLEPVKGHSDLLQALKLLPPFVKVLIAGTGSAAQALRQEAQGMEDRVFFCGFVEDVPGLMNSLDLQVNASYGTEATSMALLEGFSLGLPAVVSDFGGNPYVVEDGVNGLIFPARNPAALADAIRRIAEDPALCTHLSEGARKSYAERFRVQQMVRQTEDYYTEVLKR